MGTSDSGWAEQDARLAAGQRWEDWLSSLLLAGEISYDELRLLSPPEHAERVIERFRQRFNEAQLESLPRALAAGAHHEELLALEVSGLTCRGEDLPVISPEALRERLKAVTELRSRATPSKWLRQYAVLLVHEIRRRKQVA